MSEAKVLKSGERVKRLSIDLVLEDGVELSNEAAVEKNLPTGVCSLGII